MPIKIAVFGREKIITRLDSCLTKHDDVEIVPFVYSQAEDVVQLIEQAFMCDIYVFSCTLPYSHVKEKIEKKRLPFVLVSFNEYTILTTLYKLRNVCNQSVNRLSIDIPNSKHVQHVLAELQLGNLDIFTYEHKPNEKVNIDQLTSYHEKLWNEGKIDFAITSIEEVEQQLDKRNVPSILMEIPAINLEYAIDKAKSIVKFNQSKSAQIVAGYIRIKHATAIENVKGSKTVNELNDKLSEITMKFAHKTNASVHLSDNNQLILFGTRGVLDHLTNHYRDFPLLQEIEEALQTPVDIGFGLGLTAKQAENHAKLALEACEQAERSSCFVVNDRQDTIGPLGVKKQFDTSRLYQALIHKAKLNNELSYNFIDFITLRNNEPFSSHDIASFYRVTKRSAERTINKLLSGEVIKVVGKEKPYVKGRPRKLFQINM